MTDKRVMWPLDAGYLICETGEPITKYDHPEAEETRYLEWDELTTGQKIERYVRYGKSKLREGDF